MEDGLPGDHGVNVRVMDQDKEHAYATTRFQMEVNSVQGLTRIKEYVRHLSYAEVSLEIYAEFTTLK